MTVGELRNFLETMPEDIQVIYEYHSEFAVLEAEDIRLATPQSEQKVIINASGNYMRVWASWMEGDPKPAHVTVLVLPGN